MRAAQAYANCGDAVECRREIDAAYEALRNVPPESGEPGWCYWLDEAQINEQIGYCYLRLEDWPRARGHFRTALRLQADTYNREGALRLALLADVYAREGEPEQACEVGGRAIDTLVSQVDSARCIGHVRRLQSHLAPFKRTSSVQDFNNKVAQLVDHAH
jgi:tetratricopeptide (TPR) repeat protein